MLETAVRRLWEDRAPAYGKAGEVRKLFTPAVPPLDSGGLCIRGYRAFQTKGGSLRDYQWAEVSVDERHLRVAMLKGGGAAVDLVRNAIDELCALLDYDFGWRPKAWRLFGRRAA